MSGSTDTSQQSTGSSVTDTLNSPDFWRNLMMFGAQTNMAANARTPQGFLAYGTGPMGAIGAGTVGAAQQALEYQKTQNQAKLNQAQVGNLQSETTARNVTTNSSIQAANARLAAQGVNYHIGPDGSMVSGAPPGAEQLNNQNSPTNITTPQQATQATISSNVGRSQEGNVIPAPQRKDMIMQAVSGTNVPPALLDAHIQAESNYDTEMQGSKGEIGLAQILPSTARNPGVPGVPAVDPVALSGSKNAGANLHYAALYLDGIGRSKGLTTPEDWQDPMKVGPVVYAYNHGPNASSANWQKDDYVNSVGEKMARPPSWTPQGAAAISANEQQASAGSAKPTASNIYSEDSNPLALTRGYMNWNNAPQLIYPTPAMAGKIAMTLQQMSQPGVPGADYSAIIKPLMEYSVAGQQAGSVKGAQFPYEVALQNNQATQALREKGWNQNADGSQDYAPRGQADPSYIYATEGEKERAKYKAPQVTRQGDVLNLDPDATNSGPIYQAPRSFTVIGANDVPFTGMQQPSLEEAQAGFHRENLPGSGVNIPGGRVNTGIGAVSPTPTMPQTQEGASQPAAPVTPNAAPPQQRSSANPLPNVPPEVQSLVPPGTLTVWQSGAGGAIKRMNEDREAGAKQAALLQEHEVAPAQAIQTQLLHLRDLVNQAPQGALESYLLPAKNLLNTWAPDALPKLKQDVPNSQQLLKQTAQLAFEQAHEEVGARGGHMVLNQFIDANPHLDNDPTANKKIVNAMLVAHQRDLDYATGAINFHNQGNQTMLDTSPNAKPNYKPISQFDSVFDRTYTPDLYNRAIMAANGKPSSVWASGLKDPRDGQIIAGIVARAKAADRIDFKGNSVPVASLDRGIATAPTGITIDVIDSLSKMKQ